MCGFYKAYKILNIRGDLFKKRIDFYATKQTIIQDENKEQNKKTIEKGNEVIEHFNNQMKELGTIIQNDMIENNDSLNNWGHEVQLYVLLKIYMTYGVLRPSE